MNVAKIARFRDADRYFRCPVCRAPLSLDGTSLRCANRHTFDIARQGYVNLAPGARQSPYYSRASFEDRARILRAGYYAHLERAVVDAVRALAPRTVLDVGCGEGTWARLVAGAAADGGAPRDGASAADPARVFAFDLARDSVQMAARADAANAVRWFVGNLADIPLQDGTIDCVLDVFSPSNFAEFARVAAPGATLVKVVPGPRHDIQLREAAGGLLRSGGYDNADVLGLVDAHARVVSRELVTRTMPMPPDDVRAFAAMTPLLFHVDVDGLDLSAVTELTVEAEVVVAKLGE